VDQLAHCCFPAEFPVLRAIQKEIEQSEAKSSLKKDDPDLCLFKKLLVSPTELLHSLASKLRAKNYGPVKSLSEKRLARAFHPTLHKEDAKLRGDSKSDEALLRFTGVCFVPVQTKETKEAVPLESIFETFSAERTMNKMLVIETKLECLPADVVVDALPPSAQAVSPLSSSVSRSCSVCPKKQ
jgi:hypothetical protein